MTDQRFRRHAPSWLRLANAIALTVLMSNYFAPGLLTRAWADPPTQPSTGPLSGDFFTATWQSTQQTLFGNFPSGQETAFYTTSAMITGTGVYTGQNNIGQPITLTVIRHYVQNDSKFSEEMTSSEMNERESSGQQRGVFWGTAAGPNGSVNLIGASMAWTQNGVTTTGFVPLIDHDALTNFYLVDAPTTTADNFTFAMMSESWDPNQPSGVPEDCLICAPPAQGMWCPNQDPAVIAARSSLAVCLAEATAALALAVGGTIYLLVNATRSCLLSPEPVALSACLALALAAYVVITAIAFASYLAAVAACIANYLIAYNAAAATACPNGTMSP